MKTTTNYGLKKPEGTDVVDIDNFNYNADIIDTELAKRALKTDIPTVPVKSVAGKTGAVTLSKSDVGLSKVNNWGATTSVSSTSTTTYATASAVKQAYDKAVAAFQSASDGKTKIAAAITGKGVTTSSSDTFDVMAANINKLSSVTIDGKSVSGEVNLVADGKKWITSFTLPYDFYKCVVFNNELHIFGDSITGSNTTSHYKWNGSSWTSVSTLPYQFYDGNVIVYNNEIHIIGGNTFKSTSHYKWNGSTWTSVSTLPYNFQQGGVIIYNNELHILGGNYSSSLRQKHYKWNGSTWTSVSTLPYQFYNSGVEVYNNELHLLGSNYYDNYNTHYKWNGSTWSSSTNIPFSSNNCAVSFGGQIYIIGVSNDTNHFYKWNGSWTKVTTLPSTYFKNAVVYKDDIHIFKSATHYSYSNTYIIKK